MKRIVITAAMAALFAVGCGKGKQDEKARDACFAACEAAEKKAAEKCGAAPVEREPSEVAADAVDGDGEKKAAEFEAAEEAHSKCTFVASSASNDCSEKCVDKK